MRSFTVGLLGLVAYAPGLVSAHGFVTGVFNKGVWTAGADPAWYNYPPGQAPATAGWDALNQDRGYVEPDRFGGADIACHKNATAGEKFVSVEAGETISIAWDTWSESHKGPIINYIAAYDGETTAGDLLWNKISQAGIVSGLQWVTDQLVFSNYTSLVTIPQNLKAGDYVLRHEIIALHTAGWDNGAQAYPQCINLKVGGSGTVAPTGGTAGSSLYTRDHPGIRFNLFPSYSSYPYPGPELWTAAN